MFAALCVVARPRVSSQSHIVPSCRPIHEPKSSSGNPPNRVGIQLTCTVRPSPRHTNGNVPDQTAQSRRKQRNSTSREVLGSGTPDSWFLYTYRAPRIPPHVGLNCRSL